MAPVIHWCRRHSDQIESIVCVTGQHRQMLDQVIDYFGIPIDRDLELMAPNQTLADLTSRCLTGLDAVISEYRPDCIVAQGDTTTVMAASLGGLLSPRAVRPRRSRTANRQSPSSLAGRIEPSHCQPCHGLALCTYASGSRKPVARRRARRIGRSDRQHGNRCADVGCQPRTRSRCPLAGKIRLARPPPHGAHYRPPPRKFRRRHGTNLPRNFNFGRTFPRRGIRLSRASQSECARACRPTFGKLHEYPPMRASAISRSLCG